MELIQSMDYDILSAILIHVRSDMLTPIFLFITHLGDGGLLWLLVAALCFIRRETRPCGFTILLALILGLIIGNLAIKNLVARPRPFITYPELTSLVVQGGYSFPSAHAMSSFAAATAAYCFFRHKGHAWIGISLLLLASLIALSRLYVCVHYPSDVLCGALLGIVLGLLATWLFQKIKVCSKEHG